MNTNANQPAYPITLAEGAKFELQPYDGLTKRELIAAMAMQGILANPDEHGRP